MSSTDPNNLIPHTHVHYASHDSSGNPWLIVTIVQKGERQATFAAFKKGGFSDGHGYIGEGVQSVGRGSGNGVRQFAERCDLTLVEVADPLTGAMKPKRRDVDTSICSEWRRVHEVDPPVLANVPDAMFGAGSPYWQLERTVVHKSTGTTFTFAGPVRSTERDAWDSWWQSWNDRYPGVYVKSCKDDTLRQSAVEALEDC